jgi:hypothetical protein
VSGIGRGQPRHPIAGKARFRRSRRCRVFRENFCGGWRPGRGRRCVDTACAFDPCGARRHHRNLDTAKHMVAGWPGCEDQSARAGSRGLGGSGCEASASTPRDGTPSAAPLTTRCECRTVFPSRPSYGRSNLHWRQFALALGESNLSLADALRRRPRRHHRPHRCIACDVAGLTERSSMVRSISSASLLLYGLPLRRSLLLRSGFRLRLNLRDCLLRHVALLAKLSWRCRISTHANRRHCIPITTAQRKKQLPH